MRNLLLKFSAAAVMALAALTASVATAQEATRPELPKIPESKTIGIGYASDGRGKVVAADKYGKVRQYLNVWENQSKEPNVVTYVLTTEEGRGYSATWGVGPVNPAAFGCKAREVPQFDEKAMWAATAEAGVLTFTPVDDDDLRGLFRDLKRARQDYNREVNSQHQRSAANTPEQNILILLKEKNRKKWLERGWLRPATTCFRFF
ncbi:MAG: hypothetical protein LC795_20410 [Acidobacteria bacterium]|nr:hypothetical protein [Acidobacteriota bacterium]